MAGTGRFFCVCAFFFGVCAFFFGVYKWLEPGREAVTDGWRDTASAASDAAASDAAASDAAAARAPDDGAG
jgi:hypothetical protein